MDCLDTLNNPDSLKGFQELVNDSDPYIVKRTVRAFSSIYNQALLLLAKKDISEDVFKEAMPYFDEITEDILTMFPDCDNEGVLIFIIKFIECSVRSHLFNDLSSDTSVISKQSREFSKNGLKALKDLVITPYVGGSVFIVGVKSIIRIACLRKDLYVPVVELVDQLLTSLPPTLFDHNVKSFKTILRFSLFRLLKLISKDDDLKRKIIDLMVRCGSTRKSLKPWTPKKVVIPKRKIAQQQIDDLIIGRISPPNKKYKLDVPNMGIINLTSPILGIKSNTTSPDITIVDKSILDTIKTVTDDTAVNAISKRLNIDMVCSIILANLKDIPDEMPENFASEFSSRTVVTEDLDELKRHTAVMLCGIMSPDQITLLSTTTLKPIQTNKTPEVNIPKIKAQDTDIRIPFVSKATKPSNEPLTKSVEEVITKSLDVDMRLPQNVINQFKDVDMRGINEAITNIEKIKQTDTQPICLPLESNTTIVKLRVDPRLKSKPKNEPTSSNDSSSDTSVIADRDLRVFGRISPTLTKTNVLTQNGSTETVVTDRDPQKRSRISPTVVYENIQSLEENVASMTTVTTDRDPRKLGRISPISVNEDKTAAPLIPQSVPSRNVVVNERDPRKRGRISPTSMKEGEIATPMVPQNIPSGTSIPTDRDPRKRGRIAPTLLNTKENTPSPSGSPPLNVPLVTSAVSDRDPRKYGRNVPNFLNTTVPQQIIGGNFVPDLSAPPPFYNRQGHFPYNNNENNFSYNKNNNMNVMHNNQNNVGFLNMNSNNFNNPNQFVGQNRFPVNYNNNFPSNQRRN